MNINKNIFRAYDIRGKYPLEINSKLSLLIGKTFGTLIQKNGFNICLVGKDNRISSDILCTSLIKGIVSTGVNVLECGLISTPMIYFYRNYKKIYCSIMVTASHNPKDENGFKFSLNKFGNVKGKEIEDFRLFMLENKFIVGKGKIEKLNIYPDYVNNLLSNIKLGKRKLKIIVDPGNGATCNISKEVFNKLPFEIKYICDENNGIFPNHHPDPSVSENLKMLSEKVIEEQADIGVSFDGDGDRLGIVDNLGNFIPADIFCCLFIKNILLNNQNKQILYDNKCSKCVKEIILKYNGVPIEYRTGASYTMAAVKDNNYFFGMEYSGHIYFNDRNLEPISSGVYAALRMIEIISNDSIALSEMLKEIPKYFKIDEMRISTSDDIKYQVVNKIIEEYVKPNKLNYNTIDGVKIYDGNSSILIRASNTGPNLTFIVETENKQTLKKLTEKYLTLINKQILGFTKDN